MLVVGLHVTEYLYLLVTHSVTFSVTSELLLMDFRWYFLFTVVAQWFGVGLRYLFIEVSSRKKLP